MVLCLAKREEAAFGCELGGPLPQMRHKGSLLKVQFSCPPPNSEIHTQGYTLEKAPGI